MHSVKKSFRSYFSFSKKELNGILILCILIVLIIIFPYACLTISKPATYEFDSFTKEIEAFKASAFKKPESYKDLRDQIEDKDFKAEYFEFDPNGLAVNDWQKLGLSQRQIKVIKNYEASGGKFYKKEDLKKIYSISSSQLALLEPYIRIGPNQPETFKLSSSKRYERPADIYKKDAATLIELNIADSAMMLRIRGIGPVFASRIIRYRDRLGGFHSKEQLKEVYGLDSLKYILLKDLIRVDASLIKKLNINTVTFDQMKRHPYLNFKQMNAIIQYRKQHGDYQSGDDLRDVDLLNEEIIRKIEPYTSF